MDNVEFIVTLRCKVCGDMVSLEVGLSHPEASKCIKDFTDHHEHPTVDDYPNPNPWKI